MSHRHNPGFDGHLVVWHDDDGPCPSPTRIDGFPEREYREPQKDPEEDEEGPEPDLMGNDYREKLK
jgi:hypothetical protein